MKNVIGLCLAAVAAASIFALSWAGETPGADRVGYFKSPDRDRVMAYQATGPMIAAQAREILEAAPSTSGRGTLAVMYRADDSAPGGQLTTASSLAAALRMVAEPPFDDWAWRMRINPAGRRTFD